MNEEEKKAIKRIYDVTHNSDGSYVDYIDIDDVANTEEDLDSCEGFCEAIDTVLNLIDKQNKVIDEMAKDFAGTQIQCFLYLKDKEDTKQYFIRKVEEDEQ